MLDNLKKGVQVGVMGTALVAGNVMGVGCSQPSGGGSTIENPGNNGGNTNNPGNNGGNTNNPGGNGGNNNGQTEEPTNQYGEPYTRTIGNGNYQFYSFVGENYYAPAETIVDDVNYYLGKAETHIKGLTDGFENPGYFNALIQSIKGNNDYDVTTVNSNMDYVYYSIADNACAPVCADIIKNLNNVDDQYLLYYAYRILANEAYKEGVGPSRQFPGGEMADYDDEKYSIENAGQYLEGLGITEVGQVYDDNFFVHITNLTDRLLGDASARMGVSTTDLQRVFNIALTSESLRGMHNLTKHNLQDRCNGLGMSVASDMSDARETFAYQTQDQGLSM